MLLTKEITIAAHSPSVGLGAEQRKNLKAIIPKAILLIPAYYDVYVWHKPGQEMEGRIDG
jgi:hypothetical protein